MIVLNVWTIGKIALFGVVVVLAWILLFTAYALLGLVGAGSLVYFGWRFLFRRRY